jgi:hypothetical protein
MRKAYPRLHKTNARSVGTVRYGPPMDPASIARAIAAGRVGFGVALVAAPGLLARGWVGSDGGRPGSKVLATGLGARDIALAVGVLTNLSKGAAARPWVAASAAADFGDFVATFRARRDIPSFSAVSLLVIAGGAAAAGAWLSTQDDW